MSDKPSETKDPFDSLSLYHHVSAFDAGLRHLLFVLELPKEDKLPQRFKEIEILLNEAFSMELIHHLHLIKHHDTGSEEAGRPRPLLLLHLWCLLGCTDSLEYIAGYLGLTLEEVRELLRELHHTFSIDTLVSRVREYYKQNRHLHYDPEYRKQMELWGMEPSQEPRDTAEDRKQRLRKRYGYPVI